MNEALFSSHCPLSSDGRSSLLGCLWTISTSLGGMSVLMNSILFAMSHRQFSGFSKRSLMMPTLQRLLVGWRRPARCHVTCGCFSSKWGCALWVFRRSRPLRISEHIWSSPVRVGSRCRFFGCKMLNVLKNATSVAMVLMSVLW